MRRAYRLCLVVAMSAVSLAVNAQSCIWLSCNYVSNGTFTNGGTYWNASYASFGNVTTDCGTSNIAYMEDSGSISQSFYVNGVGNSFDLDLKVYLENDTDNWWDQLTIDIHNDDTNQSETFYLHGSSYDTSCSTLSYPLTNDYSYTNVTVTISSSYLTTGTWQVDNVAFWAHGF